MVRRAREQDAGESSKSDAQVVEDALLVFLGLRALDDARAQGTLTPEAADELAVAGTGSPSSAQPRLIHAVVDPSVLVSAFIGDAEAGPGRLVTAWRDRPSGGAPDRS